MDSLEFLIFYRILCFCVLCVHEVSSSIHLNDVQLTWSEASDNCTTEGGQLLDISTFPLDRPEWKSIMQQNTSKVWIQGQFNRTYFVWLYGCRKVENNKSIMSMKLGRSVSFVSCTMFCGKSNPYIGLQGVTCYCLRDEHLGQNIPEHCDRPCFGQRSDNCGSDEYMAVYKLADENGLQFNTKDAGNCVYVSKTKVYTTNATALSSTKSITWGVEDCNAELDGFVCQKYNATVGAYEYPVYYARKSWSKSRDFCFSVLNMTLANINSVKQKLTTMRDNEKYWIGLYRQDYSEERLCGVVTLKEQMTEMREECSHKNKFICQKDDKITTTQKNKGNCIHGAMVCHKVLVCIMVWLISKSLNSHMSRML